MVENNYRQHYSVADYPGVIRDIARLITIPIVLWLLIGCASTPRYTRTNAQTQKKTTTTKTVKAAPKPVPHQKSAPHVATPSKKKTAAEGPVEQAHAPQMQIPDGPQPQQPAIDEPDTEFFQKGNASYYANKLHGKKTASGERYDKNALTAAHPRLPFNSIVKVTNTTNNKSVILRINDRGPFTKNRVIDISRAAAEKIDLISNGVTEVIVEIIKK